MIPDTLLLRQVHPAWVQQGRVTSQVFRPTPKDRKRLSVYDGDQITPENSWRHYTTGMGYSSIGVMAVAVVECSQLQLATRLDPEPFPEHAVIDFDGYSENETKRKSKQLKEFAQLRGWLYQNS